METTSSRIYWHSVSNSRLGEPNDKNDAIIFFGGSFQFDEFVFFITEDIHTLEVDKLTFQSPKPNDIINLKIINIYSTSSNYWTIQRV